MKIASEQVVLLTGASGGLGTYLSQAFAERGTRMVLVAYPGLPLEELKRALEKKNVKAIAMAADLRDPAQRRMVVDRAISEFGRVDILVNNAGVEFTAPYHLQSDDKIMDVLKVNLEAPMMLAHLVLPGMLSRKSGFILNMSSLAGRAAPALQEPYAASKAGLVSFTSSLRATYRGSGVSASVICPGFVEAGIYAKLKAQTNCAAPALLGVSRPEKVCTAVMRAIEKDLPDVIVNPLPVRPLLALVSLFPRLGEWCLGLTGGHDFFRKVYAASSSKCGSDGGGCSCAKPEAGQPAQAAGEVLTHTH